MQNGGRHGKAHRMDGPAIESAGGSCSDSWYLDGELETKVKTNEAIIVGKSIKIFDDVGIVLSQMNKDKDIYLVLLGNKKIFVRKTSAA